MVIPVFDSLTMQRSLAVLVLAREIIDKIGWTNEKSKCGLGDELVETVWVISDEGFSGSPEHPRAVAYTLIGAIDCADIRCERESTHQKQYYRQVSRILAGATEIGSSLRTKRVDLARKFLKKYNVENISTKEEALKLFDKAIAEVKKYI